MPSWFYKIFCKELRKIGFGFMDSFWFTWIVVPLLIFLARICDVTIGTIRIIFVSRGRKYLSPVLGFFEALIWLMAISQIMKNLNNFACYLAYALGFAAGNFIGIIIEEKLAIGIQIVRIIITKDELVLKDKLSAAGFGVTVVDAMGSTGEVKIIYTVVKRKDIKNVVQIIESYNEKAFYSIEDARTAKEGIFPGKSSKKWFRR